MDPLLPPPPFPSLPTSPLTSASTSPTPTPTAEPPPQNHVAHLANATPTLTQTYNHPPYAEMIYAAITALKEQDGSSKRAITKYIEKAYSGLPPTHPTLLTHHLKRLKSSGLLVMNKKSYMLPPRSDAPGTAHAPATTNGSYPVAPVGSYSQPLPQQPQFQQVRQEQQPLFPHPYQQQAQFLPSPGSGVAYQGGVQVPVPGQVAVVNASAGIAGVKRGRGRPPKPKSVVHPGGNVQVQQPVVAAEPNSAAQPVFVALGLADDTTKVAKRRPGRPKKAAVGEGGGVAPVAVAPGVKRGRGRPPRSGGKLGRPRKPKSIASGNYGVKRGPGRPPKNPSQCQTTLVNVPFAIDPALLNVPKPRGRPKKGAVPGVGGVVPMKRPGRPPKAIGGVIRPRKSTGRPVGRPWKNALLSNEAHRSQSQSEAYEDLKKKLEFFQSRIMQAVGVLKPQFTSESGVSAVAAIQELEGLASMDITMPFREQPVPTANHN